MLNVCVLLVVAVGCNSLVAEECSHNETYLACGPNCEKTCSNLQVDCRSSELILCPGGCYCNYGFARTIQGKCVLERECETTSICGRHEIYSNCGPGCDLYCDDLQSCNMHLIGTCAEGCYCAPGFIRNRNNNLCVRQARCNI